MSHKILVIEKARFSRAVIREALENAGFEVVGEADNEGDAFGLFCTHRPSLVTLDTGLPDAVALMEEMRKTDPGAKLLLISTADRKIVEDDLIRNGVLGMIFKPIRASELTHAVQTLLGGKPDVSPSAPLSAAAPFKPRRPSDDRVVSDKKFEFDGYKILFVEDQPQVLRALVMFLLRERFQVATAANGQEAVESISRDRPHVIVTDVMMPKMDGLQLLKSVRGNPAVARTPVIVLSQKWAVEDRLRGLECGADDYLGKPFSPREMVLRIKANLRKAYK